MTYVAHMGALNMLGPHNVVYICYRAPAGNTLTANTFSGKIFGGKTLGQFFEFRRKNFRTTENGCSFGKKGCVTPNKMNTNNLKHIFINILGMVASHKAQSLL